LFGPSPKKFFEPMKEASVLVGNAPTAGRCCYCYRGLRRAALAPAAPARRRAWPGCGGRRGGVTLLLECWRFVNVDSSMTNRKKEYVMDRYSYSDWRSESPEYRVMMRRLGRSWWMREFGLRKFRLVRLLHPAFCERVLIRKLEKKTWPMREWELPTDGVPRCSCAGPCPH